MVDFEALLLREDELCSGCEHRRGDHSKDWVPDSDDKPMVLCGRCWKPDCPCNRFEEGTMTTDLALIEKKAKQTIAPVAADALSFAKEVQIDDDGTYKIVAEWLTETQTIRKEIEATFDPGIAAQKVALETLRASKNRYAKPYEDAVMIVKGKLKAYWELKEAARREQEAKLREQAKAEAEAKQKAKAEKLVKEGKVEQAQALIQAPVKTLPIIVGPAVPKVDGISSRGGWKFRIVDEALIPREYLSVDEGKIGKVVRALEGRTNIPGVEVYEEKTIVAEAR